MKNEKMKMFHYSLTNIVNAVLQYHWHDTRTSSASKRGRNCRPVDPAILSAFLL